MFGAGGGTSSYREVEQTDLVILWGSNARETHPIFFHHLLRGVRNGARLIAVDPRRTGSAEWADVWLGLDVGSDISLANAMAREIIHEGLADTGFIARATTGYDEFARCVEAYPLERAERETGVPAAARSRASSHDAGRKRLPSRTRGWVRRWRPSSIADTITRSAPCERARAIHAG